MAAPSVVSLCDYSLKKMEKDHKIIRAVLLIIGWLAAGYGLFFCVFWLDWDWNFFNFSPRWSVRLIREMAGILAALTAIWFLAKASRDKASRAVSLLVCLLLAGQAVAWSTAEPLSDSQPVERREIAQATNSEQAMVLIMNRRIEGIFSRKEPSPIWDPKAAVL